MSGQFFNLQGQIVTAEEALRAAASFIGTDLKTRGDVLDGRVAWEYVLRMDTGHGRQFDLRVKIWGSDIAASPYHFARSVHVKAPHMLSPYVGNGLADTVVEALLTAIRDTMYPIEEGRKQGYQFDMTWLHPNHDYATTPGYKD